MPPGICLIKKIQTAINNNIGNQERSIPNSDGIFSSNASAATVWVAAGDRVSIEKTPAVVISADDGATPTPTAVTAATVFASKIAYGN